MSEEKVKLFTDIFIDETVIKVKWYEGITSNFFFRVSLLGLFISLVLIAGLYFFFDYNLTFKTIIPLLILGNIIETFIVFFVSRILRRSEYE